MSYEERIEEIDLKRYWLVIKRRWKPASAVFLATALASTAAVMTQKPLFEASSKVLLQNDNTAGLTGINSELGSLETLKSTSDPLATQAEIIFSGPVLSETIQALSLKDDKGKPVAPSALAVNLKVEPIDNTDMIRVAYRSEKPVLSATVVNQIIRSYMDANERGSRGEIVAARQFLEEELPRARREADSISEALKDFREDNGIVALPAEAAAMVNAIANLESEISTTQVDLVEATSRANELSSQLGMSTSEALRVAAVNQSPAIQTAQTQLQTVRSELATALTRYTPQHPSIQELERQEAAMTRLVRRRVEAVIGSPAAGTTTMSSIDETLTEELVQAEVDRASTYQQLNQLMATRDAYAQSSIAYPGLEKTQTDLQQKQVAAQSTLNTLQERFQEIQLAEKRMGGTAQVIEEAAIPQNPTVEGQLKYLLAGCVVGAFLGVATAFFLDLIDRSIKTVKDGEKVFDYVVLGAIPHFNLNKDDQPDWMLPAYASEEDGSASRRIIMLENAYPILAGAYQMLQANLRFISSDKKLTSLVMTSSVAGEGKSEVSANLAASIAQTNRRVLLVDADMRSPNQHHLWNVVNAIGLSHVLVGEGSLKQALQPIGENLTLLPAGVTPPNPMALLDSERMANLIELFREQFDYIIFDTPALAGCADAAVLGNLTDGVLMVMRPRQVTFDRAIAAKSLLARSGVNVLGLVANGVDSKNDFGEYSYDASDLTDSAKHTARIAKGRLEGAMEGIPARRR